MVAAIFASVYRRLFGGHFSDPFRELIPEETELIDFCEWAFGEGYDTKESIEIMNAWNGLHADEYRLEPTSTIQQDAKEMVKLWRERK